jgi:hypothetical protein
MPAFERADKIAQRAKTLDEILRPTGSRVLQEGTDVVVRKSQDGVALVTFREPNNSSGSCWIAKNKLKMGWRTWIA